MGKKRSHLALKGKIQKKRQQTHPDIFVFYW